MKAASTYIASGNVAVITGASSGIGRAAARHCAKAGMQVFLADIDEKELESAVTEVKKFAGKRPLDIKGVKCDVSDPDSVEKLKNAAFAATGAVHFLMNNAAVGMSLGPLAPLASWQKLIGVNTWGPIMGCQAFVPEMKASGAECLIINTGSKQGITCPPGDLAYNVSKAALKVYTEGLEHELRQEKDRKVAVGYLVPGMVNTSIALKNQRQQAEAKGEEFDPLKVFFSEEKPFGGAWMPEQIIDYMITEIDKGTFYMICPDNDVDEETDKLRMTWAMQDVTERRPPLSRWHPDCKEKFESFIKENKKA